MSLILERERLVALASFGPLPQKALAADLLCPCRLPEFLSARLPPHSSAASLLVLPGGKSRVLLADFLLLTAEAVVELLPRLKAPLHHGRDSILVFAVKRGLGPVDEHRLQLFRRDQAHDASERRLKPVGFHQR